MEDYIIIMRLDLLTKGAQPSPEQLQVYMQQYHDWIATIEEQDKFLGGKGLSTEGKVIKSDNIITDGPYAEIKESIAGYIMVKAESLEEAAEMASRCPILKGEGNSVEVRKVISVHHSK